MKKVNVCVIGLGYVGLPVAMSLAKKFPVVGFDINESRVRDLNNGFDETLEFSSAELKDSGVLFTSSFEAIGECNFFIVAVPTPIDAAKQPDLRFLLSASRTVGSVLKKGDIVVFESTVYPGVTEECCQPVLEEASGLRGGIDFKLGYSPERINPGDRDHTFSKIMKIISAQDKESLALVKYVYGSVVEAGVYEAQSIKVAEAAKVIENTQRDVNIALMNELAILFDRMGIETLDVLEAASTKWNFLNFKPGLVGGHCIGVDPYYLTHRAEVLGYKPEVILSGRRINDYVANFIVGKLIRGLIKLSVPVRDSVVTLMGVTFKENCPDVRNSKSIDIANELVDFDVDLRIYDPFVKREHLPRHLRMYYTEALPVSDAYIVSVAHKQFLGIDASNLKFKGKSILIDVKGIFGKQKSIESINYYWRL